MSEMKQYIKIISNIYSSFATILLNAVILFLIVNLLADGYLDIIENTDKKRKLAKQGMRRMFRKYEPPLSAVYPDLKEHQVTQLIKETTSIHFIYEPYTIFKHKHLNSQYVNTDTRGFRPIENQGPWPPPSDDTVVFVFGGSTAFGWGVPDYQTIPSFLQKYLREKIHGQVWVYNLGRCSYIAAQERIFLEQLINANIIPDVAVFFDGFNDSTRTGGAPSFTDKFTEIMETSNKLTPVSLIKELPVIKVIRNTLTTSASKRISNGNERNNGELDPKKVAEDLLVRYIHNKQFVERIGKAYHFRTLFVWQPVPCYNYELQYSIFANFNYSYITPYTKSSYEYAKQAYNNHRFGDNFLWLADMQADIKKPLYTDAYHYSAEMNGLIAGKISEHLFKKGFFE